jgi:tetratricopeptide (TPR) repeat protein
LGEYYEECITACNQALATGIHFHHENAIWIERRKAHCQAALQQFDAAAVAYKTLIAKKPVWFIYFEYARVLAHLNQPNEALQNLALAMLAPGPTAMKVHVVGTLTQLLRQLGKHAEADAHQELHKTIYNEKNWRKPLQYQTDSLDQENEAPENETIKQLVAKLRGFWKSVSRPTPVLLKGTVIKMNPGNLSGFIKTTQGLSYYFATGDWMDNHSTPSVGQQVSFALTKRFNKKKQESNDVAILINPLTN